MPCFSTCFFGLPKSRMSTAHLNRKFYWVIFFCASIAKDFPLSSQKSPPKIKNSPLLKKRRISGSSITLKQKKFYLKNLKRSPHFPQPSKKLVSSRHWPSPHASHPFQKAQPLATSIDFKNNPHQEKNQKLGGRGPPEKKISFFHHYI